MLLGCWFHVLHGMEVFDLVEVFKFFEEARDQIASFNAVNARDDNIQRCLQAGDDVQLCLRVSINLSRFIRPMLGHQPDQVVYEVVVNRSYLCHLNLLCAASNIAALPVQRFVHTHVARMGISRSLVLRFPVYDFRRRIEPVERLKPPWTILVPVLVSVGEVGACPTRSRC